MNEDKETRQYFKGIYIDRPEVISITDVIKNNAVIHTKKS